MIRDGARAALWRAREVMLGLGLLAVGLWLMRLGGYLLLPVGAALGLGGLALGLLGLRRMRFAASGGAPGIVTVDEAQISYMGPQLGGFVSLPDLIEIRLVTMRGRRMWRLKQADGQALLVPLDATGAEALFDAFSALPGLSSGDLVAALSDPGPRGAGVVRADIAENRLVWQRRGRAVMRR